MTPAGSPTSDPDPTRVVFFGSGEFAIPSLEVLLDLADVRVVAVISTPDRPAGRSGTLRPTPVTARARTLELPLLQPERLREPGTTEVIAALDPALGVLADYGRIVPPSLLAVPAHGILNVHPSLLPRHRGATPIPATLLAGDATAGVTIIRMDEGLDTGPIVAQVAWPLRGDETAPALEMRAAREGAELLRAVVPDWLAGRRRARPQAAAGATLTRPLTRADGRLDGDRPAVELERRVRALQPWPGAFLEVATGHLIVHAAAVGPADPGDLPGRLVADGDGLAIATPEGRLRLLEVQPQGGRRMSAGDYLRGRGRALLAQG